MTEPTWRYHYADGRRFTSCLAREYAEAQARAVETVDGTAITKIEQFVHGKWCLAGPSDTEDKDGK